MHCLIVLIALTAPRLAIVLLVIFSDYIGQAYEGNLVPFLGFVFVPFTTLAYAWAMNARGELAGFHMVVWVIALLVDLGIIGGSAQKAKDDK